MLVRGPEKTDGVSQLSSEAGNTELSPPCSPEVLFRPWMGWMMPTHTGEEENILTLSLQKYHFIWTPPGPVKLINCHGNYYNS